MRIICFAVMLFLGVSESNAQSSALQMPRQTWPAQFEFVVAELGQQGNEEALLVKMPKWQITWKKEERSTMLPFEEVRVKRIVGEDGKAKSVNERIVTYRSETRLVDIPHAVAQDNIS